jgi:hypothetical protein
MKFINPLAKKFVIGQSFMTYCFLFMVILLAKMKKIKKVEKEEMEGK